jgi:predicted NAD-dependent protein-ADP-ribosyltransferase YbiA (DUF1768 family)
MHLIKQIIKVDGHVGVAQGGPFSPLAANIYLNEVDWAFEAIRRNTAEGPFEAVNYHRFADDIVREALRASRMPELTGFAGRPLCRKALRASRTKRSTRTSLPG